MFHQFNPTDPNNVSAVFQAAQWRQAVAVAAANSDHQQGKAAAAANKLPTGQSSKLPPPNLRGRSRDRGQGGRGETRSEIGISEQRRRAQSKSPARAQKQHALVATHALDLESEYTSNLITKKFREFGDAFRYIQRVYNLGHLTFCFRVSCQNFEFSPRVLRNFQKIL